MTEYYQARVLDVTEIQAGSELTSDTASGSFTLLLYDTSDFNDEGGQVQIDGTTYGYTTKNDDLSTITLSTPTGVAYTADEEVYLYPLTIEKEAMVQIDQEDAVMARVPFSLFDAMSTIVRSDIESESVMVYNDGGDWVIHDVLGSRMVRDAAYLDQASLDAVVKVGPTAAPLTSPTPVLTGNIHSILGKFDTILNATRYNLYINTSDPAPADEAHYVGTVIANQFQIDTLPASLGITDATTGVVDRSLQKGVTYYISVVALNDIGVAPVSPSVGVELRLVTGPDIAADYAYLGEVSFDKMTGGKFQSTVVWAGKLTTRDTDFQAGAEIDPVSYRGFGMAQDATTPAPLIFEIPFDGRPAFFAGDVQARTFTAYQGANFYGDANNVKANGGLYLESGAGGAVAAPTVAQSVPSVATNRATRSTSWGSIVTFNVLNCRSLNWDAITGYFTTVQNQPNGCVHWNIDAAGVVTGRFDQNNYRGGGIITVGTKTIHFYSYIGNGNTTKWGFLMPSGWFDAVYTAYSASVIPAVTTDQDGLIRVAELVPGSGGQVRVQRFSVPASGAPVLQGTSTLTALLPATAEVGSINFGAFDLGSPSHHVMIGRQQYNTPVRVTAGASTAEAPDLEWVGGNLIGLCMNAQASTAAAASDRRWFGLATDSRLYTYGTNTWDSSQTDRHVVGVTMATDTAESQVGDKLPYMANKRWTVTVTAPSLITPATRAGVYVWRGATGLPIDAQMIRQGYTPNGTKALLLTSIAYTGGAPGGAPTAAAYPSSSPAFMKSQGVDSIGSIVDLQGSGAGRTGPVEWDLSGRRIKVAILTPSTSVTAFTVAQSATWKQIIFPNTFDYGGISFSLAESVLTITDPGLYFVSYSALFDANATGRRLLGLEIFTTEAVGAGNRFWYDETSSANGVIPILSGATDVYLNAGTKMRMIAYQNSGVALNVRVGSRWTIRKVG